MEDTMRRHAVSRPWLQRLLSGVLLCWLAAPSAHAASSEEEFREQYQRAGKLYAAKDYSAAIPALLAAYSIQPLPQLLFNIGQAYRRLEQWSSARVYFDLYRTLSPGMDKAALAELEALILEIKEREQAERRPEVREKTRTLLIREEKPLPRWLRPVAIGGGAAGAGLLLIGGVLLGRANAPILECPQVFSSKTPGAALTAVGASLLVAGAVSFGLTLRKPARPQGREMAQERVDVLLIPPGQTPATEPPPLGWDADGSPREPPPAGYVPDSQPK
jgi:hypothetical protein